MKFPRITIFAGHYGSGKTSVAVQAALEQRKVYDEVFLCDMDIVNPYVRAADHQEVLARQRVAVLSSPLANTNLESFGCAELQPLFVKQTAAGVIDLGGDESGARALGRSAKELRGVGAEMFLVVNFYRPMSRDVAQLVRFREEIEQAAGLAFTGLVHNSNLGTETTADTFQACRHQIEQAQEVLELPLVVSTVKPGLEAIIQGACWTLSHLEQKFC